MADSTTDNEVCGLCSKRLNQPYVLGCHHSFCYPCLEEYVIKVATDNHFPCPECGHVFSIVETGQAEGIDTSQDSRTVATDNQKCTGCYKIQPLSQCRQCENRYCTSCKDTHDSLPGCQDPDVMSLCKNYDVSLGVSSVRREVTTESLEKCRSHQDQTATLYCSVCSTVICTKCVYSHHKGHGVLDMYDKELKHRARGELQELTDNVELHIRNLYGFSNSLYQKQEELNKSLEINCNVIDEQVSLINGEVSRIGEMIKSQMKERSVNFFDGNGDDVNLGKMTLVVKKLTSELEASAEYSRSILKNDSFLEVAKRLPRAREERDNLQRRLHLPNIPRVFIELKEINEISLRSQFSMPTFESKTCYEFNFLLEKVICDQTFSTEFGFKGKKYQIGAYVLGDNGTLCVGLEDLTGCGLGVKFDFTLKLVNQLDDSKSVTKKCVETFKTLFCGHYIKVMDMNIFRAVDGFVQNGTFTIQAKLSNAMEYM